MLRLHMYLICFMFFLADIPGAAAVPGEKGYLLVLGDIIFSSLFAYFFAEKYVEVMHDE